MDDPLGDLDRVDAEQQPAQQPRDDKGDNQTDRPTDHYELEAARGQ